jgi:hypothetical protein
MARYNNSYRMMHFNSVGMCDAVATITKETYEYFKENKHYHVKLQGNRVLKSLLIHDFYPLYDTIHNIDKKNRLKAIEKGL